jgi:non-heme chloroperoxidase
MRDVSWFQGMQGGLKNELDSIKVFSETDFTEDLEKFDVRTLIIHGDDDQIVLIAVSATLSSKLVRNATLKIYRGCPHGPADTHTDQPSSTRKDAHMEALAFAFLPGRAGSAAR